MPDVKSGITRRKKGNVRTARRVSAAAPALRGLAGRGRRRLGGLLGLLALGLLGAQPLLRLQGGVVLLVEVGLGRGVAGHLGELRLFAQEVGLVRPRVRVVRVERGGLLGELQPLGRALLRLVVVGLVGRLAVVDENLVGTVLGRLVLFLLGDIVGALPLLARQDGQRLGLRLRRRAALGALGEQLVDLLVPLHLPVEEDDGLVSVLVGGLAVENVLVGRDRPLAEGEVLGRGDAGLELLLDGAGDEERRVPLRRVEFVGLAEL